MPTCMRALLSAYFHPLKPYPGLRPKQEDIISGAIAIGDDSDPPPGGKQAIFSKEVTKRSSGGSVGGDGGKLECGGDTMKPSVRSLDDGQEQRREESRAAAHEQRWAAPKLPERSGFDVRRRVSTCKVEEVEHGSSSSRRLEEPPQPQATDNLCASTLRVIGPMRAMLQDSDPSPTPEATGSRLRTVSPMLQNFDPSPTSEATPAALSEGPNGLLPSVPRFGLKVPRIDSGNSTPRIACMTARLASLTPRLVSLTPRTTSLTPRGTSSQMPSRRDAVRAPLPALLQ